MSQSEDRFKKTEKNVLDALHKLMKNSAMNVKFRKIADKWYLGYK